MKAQGYWRLGAFLALLFLASAGLAQYPYNIQINQGQYPYYTSPYLQRTYQNGTWVYHYDPRPYAPASVAPVSHAQEPPVTESAVLKIYVPVPEATVWIEGKPIAQKGTERRFELPLLEPGSIHLYKVRVEWLEAGKKVERSAEVMVKAGRASSLRFLGAPAGG